MTCPFLPGNEESRPPAAAEVPEPPKAAGLSPTSVNGASPEEGTAEVRRRRARSKSEEARRKSQVEEEEEELQRLKGSTFYPSS